jgi:predicted nucleic acid-binding Zn ribbon protein
LGPIHPTIAPFSDHFKAKMTTKMGEPVIPEDLIDQSESESSESENENDNGGSSSGTSTSFPGDQQSESEDARRMEIIEQEEKRVRKARYVLMATIIALACVVTAAVYISSKNKEYDVFVKKVCSRSSPSIRCAFWSNFKDCIICFKV